MKKLFKLVPVTLGLIAMASCSNDDIFEGKTAAQQNVAGDAVNVTVENLYSTTRSAHTASKALKWVNGDQFRIFDSELSKYDTYEFQAASSAFARKYTTQRVANEDITYAVFPSNYVSWTNYDEETGDVKLVMTLPSQITYNGSSEKDFSGTLAYVSNLPMQGAAQYDATYGAKMPKMQYMTGIVAVTLDNVQAKATWLKLSADKPLAGSFEATIETDAILQKATDGIIVDPTNDIYVNIENAPRSRAIVYLPVIAQTYGALKVSYTTTVNADPTAIGTWHLIKDFVGTETSITVPRGGSVANSVLEASINFDLDTHTPEALTTVLSDRKSITGDLVLNIDYINYSTNTDAAQWYTVKVPNMGANTVTLQMPNGIDNTTSGNTQTQLVISDADTSNPYGGKFVLDLGAAGTLDATNKQDIVINMANAEVELIGDWTNAKSITVTKARAVTFGDGETTTLVGTATSPVTLTSVSGNVTIEKETTCASELGIPADADNFYVKGLQSANVNAGLVNTEVTGSINARLIARGNVKIERETSGMGIKSLTLNGNNQNIYLNCGYISQINTSAADASNYVAKIYNQETGITGIGTVDAAVLTLRKDGKKSNGDNAPAAWKQKLEFQGSKWAGEPATGAVYIDADLYTASQLAGIDGDDAAYMLWADMDLDNKNWSAINLQEDFNGQGFTISNLKLTQPEATVAAATNTGVGLFAQVSAAKTIKNFTLSTVTWAQPADYTVSGTAYHYDYANIGAVAGVVSAAATFQGITVTGATLNGTNRTDVYNVGGLIGKATDAVVLGGATAGQENSVTATITGYYALAGLVGEVNAAGKEIAINKCTVAPTFTVNKNLAANKQSDVNYGKVGDLVGTITAGTVDVKNNNTVTSGIAGKKEALKFRQHKNYYAISTEETQEQYYFGCMSNNNWVGFSAAGTVLKSNGTEQINRYAAAGNSVAVAGATNFNYFVLDAATVNARYKK